MANAPYGHHLSHQQRPKHIDIGQRPCKRDETIGGNLRFLQIMQVLGGLKRMLDLGGRGWVDAVRCSADILNQGPVWMDKK